MIQKLRKMMNFIAITLVVSQLAVGSLFSPSPPKNNNGGDQQVIFKDGHRAVVVEYAETSGDGGNTKVSINPPQGAKPGPDEDQLSRAAASVAGVAQKPGPGEVICDVYGKCKHVITGTWGKAKDKASEAEGDAKGVVGEAVDKAKDLASRGVHKAEESPEGVRQNAKEKVSEAKEVVGEGLDKAKDLGSRATRKAEETTESVRQNAKEKAQQAGEMARGTAEKVKGKSGEVVEETAEKMKQKGREGKKEVSGIAKRGKEAVSGVMRYMFRAESVNSVMNTIHMIGFSTGYGISVWVTFIMSHVLGGVLSRQQFGMVQSKIYPVYFRTMVGSLGLALMGHVLGRRSMVFKNKGDMLQTYNLMGSLLSVLGNLLYLEPKATKAMFRRMKMEKEEGRGRDRVIGTMVTDTADPTTTTTTTTSAAATTKLLAPSRSRQEEDEARSKMGKLNEALKKLNSYSSLLNITTLMGLTWHLVYLSRRLSC